MAERETDKQGTTNRVATVATPGERTGRIDQGEIVNTTVCCPHCSGQRTRMAKSQVIDGTHRKVFRDCLDCGKPFEYVETVRLVRPAPPKS